MFIVFAVGVGYSFVLREAYLVSRGQKRGLRPALHASPFDRLTALSRVEGRDTSDEGQNSELVPRDLSMTLNRNAAVFAGE